MHGGRTSPLALPGRKLQRRCQSEESRVRESESAANK